MISIPRDTQVNLHRNGKMDKLTHSAMYGIDETISTIEDFLDLKVNYYAKTNFSGITNIIDALGKIVLTHDASNMQESSINIQNLNKGVYFVQINDGSKMITKKFIKD